MAIAMSYHWLFHWDYNDYTFYKWGYKYLELVKGHDCMISGELNGYIKIDTEHSIYRWGIPFLCKVSKIWEKKLKCIKNHLKNPPENHPREALHRSHVRHSLSTDWVGYVWAPHCRDGYKELV